MGYYAFDGDLNDTDFKPISYTGVWKKANGISFHLGWSATEGTFQISKWKLEKGNKATDWTPAPEDVNAAIESKTQTFTAQPTTPYARGDIYRNGSSIYVCTTARASGSYVASDWTLVGDVTANNTAADTAKVGGITAVTVRDNAAKGLAIYNDVMSDLKITPVEKTALNTEWVRIQAEYDSLLSHAASLAVSTTAFSAAYAALNSTSPSMTSILGSMTTTTTLTAAQRDALRTQFTNYYAQVTALNKAISDKIAANAKAYTDAIEIGGANLLYRSYDKDLWIKYGSPTISNSSHVYTTEPLLITQTSFEGSGGTSTLKVYRELSNLEAGKTITISAYVKNRGAKPITVNTLGFTITDDLTVAAGASSRIVFTGTTAGGNLQFRILTSAAADAFAVDIIDLKFEYGSKATSWTPSTKEVEDLVETKARTFTAQPTIPYSKGDIWKDGSTIKVSTVTRTSGSYTAADWILVGDVTSNNTAADTAKVNGISAATVASNAANGAAVYADVMSDLKITPVEKTAINQEWNRIQSEYASLLAQATTYGIATSTYTAAYTGLSTTSPAMSTILSSMSTTTTLTAAQRDAYKTQYSTYYTRASEIAKLINDAVLASANTYVDNNTGNLINNISVSGSRDRWNTGTISNQTFENVSIPVLTLTTTGDLQATTARFKADPSKAYEVSVWLKSDIAHGSTYIGLNAYSKTGSNIGVNSISNSSGANTTSANTNFYFWSTSGASVPTGWTKYVAYIMPTGTVSTTMKNIGDNISSNARMLPHTSEISIRILNYSNSGTSTTLWVAHPKVVEVDPNAITRGTTALDNATAALSAVNDMSADNVLTPLEKKQTKTIWDSINNAHSNLLINATTAGVSATAYTTAYNTLNTYLTSLFSNMNASSAIVRTTFNTNFATLYTKKAELERLITDASFTIGGENLLDNTSFTENITGWSVYGGTNTIVSQTVGNGATKCLSIVATGANQGIYRSLNNRYTATSVTVTVSFWAKASANSLTLKVASDNHTGTSTVTLTTAWQYYSLTLTKTTANPNIVIYSGAAGTFYVSKLKYEKGSVATAWTPSTYELDASISSATTTASSANDKATAANNTLNDWKTPNATTIDGAKITTGSITATQLSVQSLSALNAKIGTITTTGTQGSMTISDSLIEIRDAYGNIRVRLGIW